MMTCKEAQNTLAGRIERSDSDELWRAFEQHMSACEDCDSLLSGTESIRAVLRRCCRRWRAPQSLRSRIALALPHRTA